MSESRQRHTPGNRGLDETQKWRITELIRNEQWSPRQISGRLGREGINVSHETIYPKSVIRKVSFLIFLMTAIRKMDFHLSDS